MTYERNVRRVQGLTQKPVSTLLIWLHLQAEDLPTLVLNSDSSGAQTHTLPSKMLGARLDASTAKGKLSMFPHKLLVLLIILG